MDQYLLSGDIGGTKTLLRSAVVRGEGVESIMSISMTVINMMILTLF
ncbi:MAG: hypothetical protein P0107_00510 [Nitrosomonas sp.]|nr:hypothetical protein [Nitrosomonas sp.]